MSAVDLTASAANAFVDQLVAEGLADAVVAPGSRSAPLALAFARHGAVRVHVVLDERSAAFVALGIATASGRAAAVVCTSGTAAVNFHPAVVEAHHARVPLVVCTADRPPELQGVGAPQTIDQRRLYGGALRWFADPGAPDAAADLDRWREVAQGAWRAAHGRPPGPAHVNLPWREPLVPAEGQVLAVPRRPPTPPAPPPVVVESIVDSTTTVVREHPRGVLVLGFGAAVDAGVVDAFTAATGWPVLADPVGNGRVGPAAISTYEALARSETVAAAHRPDAVLRIGAPLTSTATGAWLARAAHHVLVDTDGVWIDPDRRATARVLAEPDALLGAIADRFGDLAPDPDRVAWRDSWRAAERVARAALDAALDADAAPLEARVARDVAGALPDGSTLLVASSLPVRALEWSMRPREGLRVLANRGANGIDGFTSTVIGAALASAGSPTVALVGDLCFLHDTNGLLGASARGVDAVFVVVDNDGGGIFAMLPPAREPEFEDLFATPHGLDLVAVARAHGAHAQRVDRAPDVVAALTRAIEAGGVHVLVVPVDRAASVERHRALWDAVAARL
ncbi:MAG TPA: 2-succinyl-5-enolpyruvyl-6-hydroxy-3-cyclohexene-1-carboxylic-acid synthase [Acidimicrobiia bacterium]|nr:2-succinyl-5-enolpyruvyl-6-hydroxy-3-cyclohexene-1-carboxylic-acid synthase [Acidimicrobiia bacterium]